MKPKIFYTKRSLPLILEAIGYKEEFGYINYQGKKVKVSDVAGFQKDVGIITK